MLRYSCDYYIQRMSKMLKKHTLFKQQPIDFLGNNIKINKIPATNM